MTNLKAAMDPSDMVMVAWIERTPEERRDGGRREDRREEGRRENTGVGASGKSNPTEM